MASTLRSDSQAVYRFATLKAYKHFPNPFTRISRPSKSRFATFPSSIRYASHHPKFAGNYVVKETA